MASLDGVDAKLSRADKHLKVATRLMGRFIRNECKTVPEYDREANVVRLVARLPQPPLLVSLVLGDCVHNMRAALDHLVYQLVLSNPDRPADTPNERTMFPICDTDQGYERQINKLGRLRGVTAAAAARIDALQPYKRRQLGRDHTVHQLWVLNKMENIDKHRRLGLTAVVGLQNRIDLTDASGDQTNIVVNDRINDGAVLHSFTPQLNFEMEMKERLLAHVSFNEPESMPSLINVDVPSVMRQMLRFIRDSIVPDLSRFIR